MTYEIDIMDELVVDLLPEDVRRKVTARRRFWMPDEAASLYARAAAVVSIECHSPLIALSQGTPAFHIRQPTDTIKGHMYRDLGLGEYLFEIDEVTGPELAEAITARLADRAAMQRDVEAARQHAAERLTYGANTLRRSLQAATGA